MRVAGCVLIAGAILLWPGWRAGSVLPDGVAHAGEALSRRIGGQVPAGSDTAAGAAPAVESSAPQPSEPLSSDATTPPATGPVRPPAGLPGLWPAAGVRPEGLLFRIERDRQRAWVFGSIHVGRAEFFPLAAGVEQVFLAADAFIFEVDPGLDFELSAGFSRTFGKRADSPELSAAVQARLEAVYGRWGQSPADMGLWSPAGLSLRLGYLQMAALGFDVRSSPDAYIVWRARQSNRTLSGLESVEEQLGALDHVLADGPEMLTILLDRIESGQEANESLRLIEAWKRGDVESLEQMQRQAFRVMGNAPVAGGRESLANDMTEALLCRRNRRWVPRIGAPAERWANPVYVVGVLHLVGPCGLPTLLAREGWKVTRRQW